MESVVASIMTPSVPVIKALFNLRKTSINGSALVAMWAYGTSESRMVNELTQKTRTWQTIRPAVPGTSRLGPLVLVVATFISLRLLNENTTTVTTTISLAKLRGRKLFRLYRPSMAVRGLLPLSNSS